MGGKKREREKEKNTITVYMGKVKRTYTSVCVSLCACVCSVTQLCSTLCDHMDCSPPDSSVHGILQARILEWVATSFSRASSEPRDQTCLSCSGRRILFCWATREAQNIINTAKAGQPRFKGEETIPPHWGKSCEVITRAWIEGG